MATKITVTGQHQVQGRLSALEGKVRRQVLRKAVTAGARVVLRTEKSLAPVRLGFLRKSLGTKVKSYRNSGVVVGLVGPRTDKIYFVGNRRVRPSKYAHLAAKRNPFDQKALAAAQPEAEQTMLRVMQQEIERLV